MGHNLTPQQVRTLEQFMLRARRVQAHSVVQEDSQFSAYASGTIHLTMSTEGATLRQELPPDEEVFESFATRVRTVTLGGEPVYYKKILEAIEVLSRDDHPGVANDKFWDDVASLRERWENTISPTGDDIGWKVFTFATKDPSGTHKEATMQELADSWMYADVAHTNPKRSAVGLHFSLQDRYEAAVVYYSRIARRILLTAAMIRFIHETRMVRLNETCLTAAVSFRKIAGESPEEEAAG